MKRVLTSVLLGVSVIAAACAAPAPAAPTEEPMPADIFEFNQRLGRGVNLGNALEAPSEGEWGMRLEADFFPLIAESGFKHVRIPIRWSAHAQAEAPYTIDPEFLARVDWAVDQSLQNGLIAIVNMHHYDELFDDPPRHEARFIALWRQIAEHFKDRPRSVVFELLNEPHNSLNAPGWNLLFPKALAEVRANNPDRVVLIGPAEYNSYSALEDLTLPADDPNLIATFHYYNPFQFTHQGAEWVSGSNDWLGTRWEADSNDRSEIKYHFDLVGEWQEANSRPIYLGEFGAYSTADLESRALWTTYIAREAERRGWSWAYWEFGAGFGVYDREAKDWRPELLGALIPAP
jgi:endoglucanase